MLPTFCAPLIKGLSRFRGCTERRSATVGLVRPSTTHTQRRTPGPSRPEVGRAVCHKPTRWTERLWLELAGRRLGEVHAVAEPTVAA